MGAQTTPESSRQVFMILPSSSTVVAIVVIYGLLFAILRRPWTAGLIALYVLCFALLSSFVKQAYLGVAMTLADIHFFLLRPVENFHLFFSYPLLGMALVGVLLGAALCLLVGLRFERPVHILARPRLGGWLRFATAAASLVLGVGASLIASQELHARANDGDAYAAFLSMYEQQHPGGVIGRLNVFFNNRSFEATLPTERQQTRFTAANVERNRPDLRPDVFLVLEESTFDPTLIRKCILPECDNAMLHPLASASRTQQGPLLVHTTGGGTWLAEFAVMSGFDWRVFGRGGAYAPVSLAPRMRTSLPLQLRALGYRTVAVYPTDGNFLSATSAYSYYGFDEFYDARDLNMPSEWGDTRDAMVFEKALQLAQRQDDPRPVFVFVLTIRNHGPHGAAPEKLPASFQNAAKQTSVFLADYLARMRDSSQDYLQLAQQWLGSPRPRVIAWFGDHQPEAAWDFTEHPEMLHLDRAASNASGQQLQYLTYYQFSANFGEPGKLIARDALDLAYLGAELLAFAGLPLDPGGAASRQVAAACNGVMLDCADRALINDYLSYRIHQLGTVQ
jgi:hypothetical protein